MRFKQLFQLILQFLCQSKLLNNRLSSGRLGGFKMGCQSQEHLKLSEV